MSSVLRDDDHLSRVRATKQNTLTHCASISGQAPVFFLISNKTCHSESKAKLVHKITPKATMGPFWWLYLFISRQWPWQPWKKRWRRRKHRKKPAALSNPVDTVASLNQLKWLWFFELTSTNLGKGTLFSMICLNPQRNRGWP